jgi:hypothetical protein
LRNGERRARVAAARETDGLGGNARHAALHTLPRSWNGI